MQTFNKIQQYISAFEKKLEAVVIENISAKEYCKKYLTHLLQHKRYYLEIYASVLELVLKKSPIKKKEIALVDYGAGNGLLGLFAKYCGFNKVYINDINDNFISSSAELATLLNISIDGFVSGDIIAVADFFKSEKLMAIVGTDVIEHIYSLPDFFSELNKMNPQIVSVFTTASNPFNKRKVKKLKQLQVKDEYEGGTPNDYVFFGETALEPFIKVREEIIRKKFPGINKEEIIKLSRLTRGLIEGDIIKTVQKYIDNKIMPAGLLHSTNTCDPITGSWTERVLTLEEYKTIYAAAGFEVELYKGFYNEYSGGVKSFLLKLANKYINATGYSLAPFITLVGFSKE
jgi:2-polyprenyl-3-methyl-5-hydroxy-6-metoxy-1,4-benzoquinol methylase